MDCERKTDLGDAERQAIQKLDSELRSHGIVSQRAYNLTGAVLARMPEARLRDVSQSRKVAEECARARRVRFVPLHQLASITEQPTPLVCFLQGYPAENVERPLNSELCPLAESDGLVTLVIPPQMRRAALDPRVIGIEYPPHDGSLEAAGLPHPAGLSGGAVWLFPIFPENQVWSPEKARLVAIERGWWREEKEVIATHIEVWLRLVATQIPELRSTIEAKFGPVA